MRQTQAQQQDAYKAQQIKQVQTEYFYTLGRRRMSAVLEAQHGLRLGQSQVGRLMRTFNLCARIRRARQPSNGYRTGRLSALPGNRLNRRFQAEHPGEKFLTDVTYVRYYEQNQWHWGYLSVVWICMTVRLRLGFMRNVRT